MAGFAFVPTRHGQAQGQWLVAWCHQGSRVLAGHRVWEQLAVGRGTRQDLLSPGPLRGRPGQEKLSESVEVPEPEVVCAEYWVPMG